MTQIPDSLIYIQRDYDLLYKLHDLLEEQETTITEESADLLDIADQIADWQKTLRNKMSELREMGNKKLEG